MKKVDLLLLVMAGVYYASEQSRIGSPPERALAQAESPAAQARTPWRSGQQVQGTGLVSRVLADDNDGSRHQRFVLTLASGQTLLVAHNIDVAPRISRLREGDTVAFNGEYAWNDKGGVIHWTHLDPQGRHSGGWLEHQGQRYE